MLRSVLFIVGTTGVLVHAGIGLALSLLILFGAFAVEEEESTQEDPRPDDIDSDWLPGDVDHAPARRSAGPAGWRENKRAQTLH